ncbi:hypothetical protein AGMMS50256_19800 [Betaproteobacteria bacterium]|nr:hypothetical protein AGMMS50256_19800 [Betaproteobacteria bacterium]
MRIRPVKKVMEIMGNALLKTLRRYAPVALLLLAGYAFSGDGGQGTEISRSEDRGQTTEDSSEDRGQRTEDSQAAAAREAAEREATEREAAAAKEAAEREAAEREAAAAREAAEREVTEREAAAAKEAAEREAAEREAAAAKEAAEREAAEREAAAAKEAAEREAAAAKEAAEKQRIADERDAYWKAFAEQEAAEKAAAEKEAASKPAAKAARLKEAKEARRAAAREAAERAEREIAVRKSVMGEFAARRAAEREAEAQEAAAKKAGEEAKLEARLLKRGKTLKPKKPTEAEIEAQETRLSAEIAGAIRGKDFAAAHAGIGRMEAVAKPESLTLLRLRAWLAFAEERTDEARGYYRQILDRLDGDENAGLNLAILEARAGKRETALNILNRLSARHPDSERVESIRQALGADSY